MSDDLTVRLRGKTITITDTMRQSVLDEMPEIGWISDETLRT